MTKMNTDKDIISSAMEEFGLTMDDVMVLMKGYEKFTESSTDQKKELIDNKVPFFNSNVQFTEIYKEQLLQILLMQPFLNYYSFLKVYFITSFSYFIKQSKIH